MLYFLRHTKTGLIKIGCTNDLEYRLRELKTIYGELEVLGLMAGFEEYESELHKKFSHLNNRKKLKGVEWFNPDSELMDFIKKHTSLNKPLPIGTRGARYEQLPDRQPQGIYTMVRVSDTTKRAVNMLAAEIQIATLKRISSGEALQALVKIAFPDLAKDLEVPPHIQEWVDKQTPKQNG